ncbi:hypothetical protein Ddye_015069 [Dipteronia dyeriana]|uniref:Uncharacterized protein n=1 Tax=Dipteronia dyeriana TaxID=168575 RepID=A0AAD9WZ77_9ROSI|nr:hypothetical protein Ddye_015069 [Dipteronia dyeriana]
MTTLDRLQSHSPTSDQNQYQNIQGAISAETQSLDSSQVFQALDLEDYLYGMNQPPNMYVNVEVVTESGEKVMEKRMKRLYSQQSMTKIIQLKNQHHAIKKGSNSIREFVFKIKNIGDILKAAGEEVKERDLVMCLVNGIGHDFDAIVAVIIAQRFISFEDAQFLLMVHEQWLEHLDSTVHLNVGQTIAHYVANNYQDLKRWKSTKL